MPIDDADAAYLKAEQGLIDALKRSDRGFALIAWVAGLASLVTAWLAVDMLIDSGAVAWSTDVRAWRAKTGLA
jgi:hypothetical protein